MEGNHSPEELTEKIKKISKEMATAANAGALGTLLGLRSHRVAGRILELWTQRLSIKEKILLMDYNLGRATPDPADPFSDVHLSPLVGSQ